MRSSLTNVLTEDFITTARAIGFPRRRVLRRHAVPNALLPVVTLIALNLGFIVGGAIAIEALFSWPGIGTLTFKAIHDKDYPLLQGIFLLTASLIICSTWSPTSSTPTSTRACASDERPTPPPTTRASPGRGRRGICAAHGRGPATSAGLKALGLMLRSTGGIIGLTILVFFTLIAIIGPWIAPQDPNSAAAFSSDILAPPSSEHRLGTDDNGRDVLSQLILGTQISMLVGFAAALVSAVIGAVVGISAGYFGGWTDRMLTAIDDWFLVIPFLPPMVVLATLLGDRAEDWPLGRVSVLILVIGIRAGPAPRASCAARCCP